MSSDRRQIATEIAKRYTKEGTGYADRLYQLAFAIEAALKERDERGARICEDLVTFTEDHGGHEPCKWCEALEKAAAAIRNEDTNA